MDDAAILETIDRFLDRSVKPHVKRLEAADEYPRAIADEMAELGLFGATIGEPHGGLGLSAVTYTRIIERIARVWMSLTGIINSHLIMCAAIERFGTADLKAAYLPRMASGEMRGGIALTEPDCGTDLQAVTTRAEVHGNGFRLNGAKMWCTNAVEGNCLAVLARTGPPRRGKEVSLFLVEKSMGYRASKLKKLGYKGVDTGEIQFEDVDVPAANLIGPEQGKGLNQILAGLELGRINIAARGCGVARACLEESLEYAQTRRTFGKPIAEHQAIAMKLADMAVRCWSARLLTEQAAAAYDRGERCDMEAGMAKLSASEAALENATEAMRLHGGYGYSPEYNIERYYRDAPLLCIGEGTNEMQRLIIARQLVARHPA